MRINNIIALIIFIIQIGCITGEQQNAQKPNILFIIVDDLGWTDISNGAPNMGNGSKYYETRHWELNNLAEDIGENNNLAETNPNIVGKMGKSLIKWLQKTEADLPKEKSTGKEVPLPDIPKG